MKRCDRCGMEFADLVAAAAHTANFKHEWKPMDPVVKARIVANVEARPQLQAIFVGHVEPIVPVKKPIEIIIERTPEPVRTVKPIVEHFIPDPFRLEPEWVG